VRSLTGRQPVDSAIKYTLFSAFSLALTLLALILLLEQFKTKIAPTAA
jgi:hypothetical protein